MTDKLKESLDSPSKFKVAVTERLHEIAEEQINDIRTELQTEGADEDEELELGFAEDDIDKVKKIADELGLSYAHDEESGDFDLEVGDDVDDETVNKFFDALEEAGIKWDDADEESDLDEASLRRVKIKAGDKAKRKREYRKNKAKIRIKSKRRRKTAAHKRWKKKSKIKARTGRTATGKRKTKFL